MRMLLGPVGSGKTTALVMEILKRSVEQAPCLQGPLEGVRPTAWAFVRNTYPELLSTTIRTWKQWIPRSMCRVVKTAPIEGRMSFPLADGTRVESTIFFLSLDKPDDLEKILSMDVTGVAWNEGRFSPWELILPAMRRCGRYPMKRDVAPTWFGFMSDSNMPSMDTWIYQKFEVQKPKNWKLFKQPGGVIRDAKGNYIPNPLAENIENLPGGHGYYMNLIEAADPGEVRVMVEAQYGYMFSGQGIYADIYIDRIHYDPDLKVIPGLPIHLGWDFGYNYPACVVAQDRNGQLRILKEYLTTDKGIQQFASEIVLPGLANDFKGMEIGTSTGDPSGLQHSSAGGNHDIELLADLIPTQTASTNLFKPRREAVISRLTRMVDGQPGFLIGPGAPVMRRGMLGGYKFKRVQIGAAQGGLAPRYHPEPDKGEESHPCEAGQYVAVRLAGDVVKEPDNYLDEEEDWGGDE